MNNSNNTASAPAIAADNVSKHFGPVNPVRHVSFNVEQGEFVSLLGPSGSGKSTLLGLLAGFEQASEGAVSLQGHSLNGLNEDQLALMRRESVGFVFQAFHLIPTLSALENVAFPLYPVKMDKELRHQQAQTLLEQMGLGKRTTHLPSRLSGGERQRVAIARALVNKPSILFCDEPTGNLDSTTGNEILDILIKLNTEQELTLFIVTHDQEIARLSNRSLYMQDGEVKQS
ncbi:MAG: ABC transporter ATP-binding protein [Desulfocapsa sp.]|nr:MAG: ABC transporter ATP-binding protein [Desulfocapsa sp.]